MDEHLNVKMNTLAQQEMKTEEKTMDLRTHLTELQKWDLAEGQTIEERRAEESRVLMAHQLEDNEQLVKNTKKRLPRVRVRRTAPGEPVQAQMPAKETYKQRRERERLEKEAKIVAPLADDTSVAMVQDLKRSKLQKENSYRALPRGVKQQAKRNHVSERLLKAFAKGCQLNWMGRPVTDKDAEAKEADHKFFEDYISCDLQRRRPHLDRIVEQALSVQVTPDMFAQEYLKDHAAEVHEKLSILVCFDDLMKDPVNKPYFDELPQFTKDLIEQRILARYQMLSMSFSYACMQKAVSANSASFIENANDAELLETFREQYAQSEQPLRDMMEETSVREQEAVQRELERRMESKRAKELEISRKMKATADTRADMEGLDLTGYVTFYSLEQLASYRKMIEEHPAEYAKNPQLIDALYQGLHHGIDALGDAKFRIMAPQGEIEGMTNRIDELTLGERLVYDAANKYQNNASAEADLINGQVNAHMDALSALLRGKPLSDPAKVLLRRMGHQV